MKLNELVSFGSSDNKEQKPETGNESPKPEHEEKEEHVDKGTKIKIVAALMVVGFAVYVAWWVQEPGSVRAQDSVSTMEGTTETSDTTQKTIEVSFVDFALDPADITIDKGTTVVWTNKDTVPHTVTGPIFSSGTLDRGQSYSFTFKEDGTYEYHCSFHPQITGKIIVGAGGVTQALTEETAVMTGSEELTPELLGTLSPAAGEQMPPETVPADLTTSPENSLEAAPQETGLSEAVLAELNPSQSAQMAAAAASEAAMHDAAVKNKKLASSGPEDFIYAGAFLAILFLNRRKLFSALR